jgi:hypothetical protein
MEKNRYARLAIKKKSTINKGVIFISYGIVLNNILVRFAIHQYARFTTVNSNHGGLAKTIVIG